MKIRGQNGYRRAPAIIVAAASLTAFGLGRRMPHARRWLIRKG